MLLLSLGSIQSSIASRSFKHKKGRLIFKLIEEEEEGEEEGKVEVEEKGIISEVEELEELEVEEKESELNKEEEREEVEKISPKKIKE